MAIKPLVNYISDEIKKGKSKEDIRLELMNGGWQIESVSEAFFEVDKKEKLEKIVSGSAPTENKNTTNNDETVISESGQKGANNEPAVAQADEKSKSEPLAKIEDKPAPSNDQKKEDSKPKKPAFPRMGLVLGEAWDIYKRRFWALTSLMFFIVTISVTFSVFMSNIMIVEPDQIFSELDYFGIILFLIVYIVIPFIVLVGESWGLTSLLFAVTHHNERAGAVKSLSRGWDKIGSYWWILVLSFFILIGGIIFFLIPAIVIMIGFIFGSFVLMGENLKGLDSLLKSREYVRNYWWSVLFRLMFIGIIYLIFTAFIGILSIILWNMAKEMQFVGIYISDKIAAQIGVYLYSIITVPFLLTYLYSLYDSLRALKSGFTYEATFFKKVPYGFLGTLSLVAFVLLALYVTYTYVIKSEVPALNFIIGNTKYFINVISETIHGYF